MLAPVEQVGAMGAQSKASESEQAEECPPLGKTPDQGNWDLLSRGAGGAPTWKHLRPVSKLDCNGCFVVMEESVLVCGKCTLRLSGKVCEMERKHVRTVCQQFTLKWLTGEKRFCTKLTTFL